MSPVYGCYCNSFLNLGIEERKKMGIRSRQLAMEKLSSEVFINQYLDLIHKM